uniref:Uncharacterized protein n=1 Tax=viral metagenome TaxID=1070528 RepID=A0A6M3KLX3_9ZZZZ
MKNKFTKYERELRNTSKRTSAAIKAISQEWYADCDMRKMDKLMSRLMAWEDKINTLIDKY